MSMKLLTVLMLATTVGLSACGHSKKDRAISGGAIGAGAGAVGGAIVGGNPAAGAVVGGAVGAAAGAIIDEADLNLGKPAWKK